MFLKWDDYGPYQLLLPWCFALSPIFGPDNQADSISVVSGKTTLNTRPSASRHDPCQWQQPASDVVTVVGGAPVNTLTGIRLEMMTDASLPINGPGRFSNGNFVLTELELDVPPNSNTAIPTLSQFGLVLLAMLMLGLGVARARAEHR